MKFLGFQKVLLAAGLLTVVGACAVDAGDETDDLSEISALDGKSDTPLSTIKFVGDIELSYAKRVLYTKTPKYRAAKFHAEKGTMLEVYVRSTQGDAMAWLVGPHLEIVAESDDANEEKNSDISIESLAETGDYYVLFRDKHYESHYFDVAPVQLNKPANAPTYEQFKPAYETLVNAHTLAGAEVKPGTVMPYFPTMLLDRWKREAKNTTQQVNAYALQVAGQTMWFIRKYQAGQGMTGIAYCQSGQMVANVGGTGELIDDAEY
jgi:hypothetical protein